MQGYGEYAAAGIEGPAQLVPVEAALLAIQ